jgi:hypothetical protein
MIKPPTGPSNWDRYKIMDRAFVSHRPFVLFFAFFCVLTKLDAGHFTFLRVHYLRTEALTHPI